VIEDAQKRGPRRLRVGAGAPPSWSTPRSGSAELNARVHWRTSSGPPRCGFRVEDPALKGSIASDRPVRYLLDTNVVSEWTKPRPNPGVADWLAQVDEDEVFLSVVTFAELRHGIERLPASVAAGT